LAETATVLIIDIRKEEESRSDAGDCFPRVDPFNHLKVTPRTPIPADGKFLSTKRAGHFRGQPVEELAELGDLHGGGE
jgi:hypothetical protein